MTEDRSPGTQLPAIVLAGAPADAELKARYGVEWRSAVPVAGKMMVQHVVDALNASTHVTNICLVGDIHCDGITQVLHPAGSLIENLIAGMTACEGENGVLVATSDIPLVTPKATDDFVERCGDLSADFYYSIARKEDCERRFPGMHRTCVKLAEGTFTGGNIMVMNPRFVVDNADMIRNVLSARKSPMRLAGLIGLRTLVRAVIAQTVWPGAVNLATLEKTVGRILNARVKAVPTPYPELAADADEIGHFEAIEKILMAGELP